MSTRLKSLSPMSKILFVVSLLLLFLWVVPTMISYYKNEKIYNQKSLELEKLDTREVNSEVKRFHTEVFKIDAETYFDKVSVTSIPNNKYKIIISFIKDDLPKFYAFLRDLSLNYRVSVDDNLVYKDINKSLQVNMIVKPF
ncbi:MAG TPA: hypothetical protein ENK99_00440 [Campylobacterales bacterium]|nr:hypothetical protein [Campylobacterales bacterium]